VWEVSHPAFNPEEIDVDSAHRKVMEQILHQNQPTSVRPKLSFLYYWQQIAAILLLPLLIVSAYLYLKPASQIAETYQELFTPYGTWSVVNLPDGSKVWLNAGSSLKYPTQFNDKQRVVSMQGEAYFEVESDKEHPFIVKTKELTVEATGTAFNVNAYTSDNVTAVTLVKGKVAVTLDKKKTISLSPGEKIDYNLATALYNVNKTNTYKWCSWKDGVLIFRDDPLEYVFKRLGQTYNVEFILKDAELGKYSYKATFEGESLNEILRLLEMSAPIRCKEVSNRNTNNEKFEKQRIEVSKTIQ
jgi:transmembrane sensor